MVAQADEAVEAFRGRAKDYPCGWPHPLTGLLRISRMEQDLASITETFETTVRDQEAELLAQARPLARLVAPRQVEELSVGCDPGTLTKSLSRRVAFWEERRPKGVLKV